MRDSEVKYKKKAKKLLSDKKELQAAVKQLGVEYNKQKEYYEVLIRDLEVKLREVI